MISKTHSLRVRYAETDAMKYVYYGEYATYLEVARVELFRELGISYLDIENQGILLPVSEYTIQYLKPARYDDLLKIKTTIIKKPGVRIKFDYEIFNPKMEKIASASTTLFFLDSKKQKVIRCPEFLMKLIDNKWAE